MLVTQAILNVLGKVPVRSDTFMLITCECYGVGEMLCKRWERKGSMVGWLERRTLETSASIRGE